MSERVELAPVESIASNREGNSINMWESFYGQLPSLPPVAIDFLASVQTDFSGFLDSFADFAEERTDFSGVELTKIEQEVENYEQFLWWAFMNRLTAEGLLDNFGAATVMEGKEDEYKNVVNVRAGLVTETVNAISLAEQANESIETAMIQLCLMIEQVVAYQLIDELEEADRALEFVEEGERVATSTVSVAESSGSITLYESSVQDAENGTEGVDFLKEKKRMVILKIGSFRETVRTWKQQFEVNTNIGGRVVAATV